MPIRQTRMIALINAATDYRSLAWMMQKWLADPQLMHMSHPELLSQINSWNIEIDEAIRERAGKHNEVINAEFNHFHKHATRNEREKLEQQLRRGRQINQTRRQPKLHSQETPRLRPAFTDDIYLTGPGVQVQSQLNTPPPRPNTPEEDAELAEYIKSLEQQRQEDEDRFPKKGEPLTLTTTDQDEDEQNETP